MKPSSGSAPGFRGDVPLIGFCGAPWTVATYMVEGQGSKDQAEARLLAYREPCDFQRLIDLLVETSIAYLLGAGRMPARTRCRFSTAGREPARG